MLKHQQSRVEKMLWLHATYKNHIRTLAYRNDIYITDKTPIGLSLFNDMAIALKG